MLLFSLACGGPSPAPVSGVRVEVHPDVATVLTVTWTQEEDALESKVEYSFEDDAWDATPSEAVTTGSRSATILGVPAETTVRVRFAQRVGGEERVSEEEWTGTTGELPDDLPLPELVEWDADRTDAGRWLLATIAAGEQEYQGPWWVYILDRKARVVWYRKGADDRESVMSRVSADGTHITWNEVSWFGDPSTFERATLDLGYRETTELPFVGYTYDELPDGTIAYDGWGIGSVSLRTLALDGTLEDVWTCTDWLPEDRQWSDCGTNTVNWSGERGTYLWSMYDLATVVEVDPATGDEVASWGAFGSQAIAPESAGLQMQHFPNWTDEGTLLLHTQQVGSERVQWAREYARDAATGDLEQVWSYSTTDYYADCSGEAVRLDNGNTLLNYGCGAALREITPEGEVAWDVRTVKLVGHQTLIDDLYALNRGP